MYDFMFYEFSSICNGHACLQILLTLTEDTMIEIVYWTDTYMPVPVWVLFP